MGARVVVLWKYKCYPEQGEVYWEYEASQARERYSDFSVSVFKLNRSFGLVTIILNIRTYILPTKD